MEKQLANFYFLVDSNGKEKNNRTSRTAFHTNVITSDVNSESATMIMYTILKAPMPLWLPSHSIPVRINNIAKMYGDNCYENVLVTVNYHVWTIHKNYIIFSISFPFLLFFFSFISFHSYFRGWLIGLPMYQSSDI